MSLACRIGDEKALTLPDDCGRLSGVVSVDAIVVLGCRIAPGGKLSGPSQRRVQGAIAAYRRGLAPWVVASGGKRWHGVAEAEAFRVAMLEQVPADCVLTELSSMTTRQNATYVAELFRARAWRKAALVTCEWHLLRAERCFVDAGIECVPVPVESPGVSLWVRSVRALRERAWYHLDRGSRFGG